MNNNKYQIQKWLGDLTKQGFTGFLDQHDQNILIPVLNQKHLNYQIYKPYKDADQILIYLNDPPPIDTIQIISNKPLKHNEILGSLYSLNIQKQFFGDILISKEDIILLSMPQMSEYIIQNLTHISNQFVKLQKVQKDISQFQKQTTTHTLIIKSLRIDNIISKIIHKSRNEIIEKINKKEIILNGEIVTSKTKELKENDTFSIRKYGKYCYQKTIGKTKKDYYIIEYIKYE